VPFSSAFSSSALFFAHLFPFYRLPWSMTLGVNHHRRQACKYCDVPFLTLAIGCHASQPLNNMKTNNSKAKTSATNLFYYNYNINHQLHGIVTAGLVCYIESIQLTHTANTIFW
jgi:hypothetical protein